MAVPPFRRNPTRETKKISEKKKKKRNLMLLHCAELWNLILRPKGGTARSLRTSGRDISYLS